MPAVVKTHCKRGHEFTPENTIVKTYRGGLKGRQCRTCQNNLQRRLWVKYRIAYMNRHPDKYRKQKREQMRRWRQRNLYGIEPAEFARIFKKQNGLCAIPSCQRPIGATDHDHERKLFRGLLCRQCNTVLGLIKDNPATLQGLKEYLEISLA